MSRRIEDLTPEIRIKYAFFEVRMAEAGIDFIVTSTRRSQQEQWRLYEQGRTTPGKIVTWTKVGNHVLGRAFDIVIMENGKPDWEVSNPKWTQAGKIGTDVGLIWGGSWSKHKDFPHFELKEDL
jgi:peptidoglycan L-alanyl-D-glutamate endopeptidase CwlK